VTAKILHRLEGVPLRPSEIQDFARHRLNCRYSEHQHAEMGRNSGEDQIRKVTEDIIFQCAAPSARSVCLVGDFNNWSPAAHPMQRQPDGAWLIQLSLSRERHYYQFLVDGEPVLDPGAMCTVCQERDSKVSLIALC
jgi:1,4-alpha-glucan branching enzyme